jgi:tetratricopeptide (TPR) repeat protein
MTDYYKVYMQGVWKYENGNYSEALRYFNRSLELKPQTNAAAVYSYRGNCKLKLSDYVGSISDFDYSIAFATASPSDNMLLKTVYYSRGLANFFLGNASVACSDFQKSINAGMTDPEPVNFIRQVCK